jgi:hypothetical protein
VTREDLRALVAGTAPDELPQLVGDLAAAQAEALALLTRSTSTSAGRADVRTEGEVPADGPGRWLTPVEAAAIAGLPTGTDVERERSARRIYSWARGKRWAARPSRRCLRVDERAFRRWLGARRG